MQETSLHHVGCNAKDTLLYKSHSVHFFLSMGWQITLQLSPVPLNTVGMNTLSCYILHGVVHSFMIISVLAEIDVAFPAVAMDSSARE